MSQRCSPTFASALTLASALALFASACAKLAAPPVVVTDTEISIIEPSPFIVRTSQLTPAGLEMTHAIAETVRTDNSIESIDVECSALENDVDETTAAARAERIVDVMATRGVARERMRATALAVRPHRNQCDFILFRD